MMNELDLREIEESDRQLATVTLAISRLPAGESMTLTTLQDPRGMLGAVRLDGPASAQLRYLSSEVGCWKVEILKAAEKEDEEGCCGGCCD